jgi:MraZ protein
MVEQMFLGQYAHVIDDKGRLTIPSRYRDALAGGAYVCQGFERNLMVLTPEYFKNISRSVNQMSLTDPTSRQLKRLMYSTADYVELDNAGRIRIPAFLRENAGLESETVIAGVGEYFEIWSPDAWTPQADILKDSEANTQRFAALDISGQGTT